MQKIDDLQMQIETLQEEINHKYEQIKKVDKKSHFKAAFVLGSAMFILTILLTKEALPFTISPEALFGLGLVFVAVNKIIGSNDSLELEKVQLQMVVLEIRKEINSKKQEIEQIKTKQVINEVLQEEQVNLNVGLYTQVMNTNTWQKEDKMISQDNFKEDLSSSVLKRNLTKK